MVLGARDSDTSRLWQRCKSAHHTHEFAVASSSIVLLIVLLGILLAWSVWLLSQRARERRVSVESLRLAKGELEAQVEARASELRDSNARLQSIIDSAVDAIIVIDASGRIESFNQGAERLFGYPAAEVIGRNVNMLMPSPVSRRARRLPRALLATGEAKIIGIGREVTGRRRDGSTFPLHLSVGEMSIGGERKFTGMLHDLTRARALEEQLRASEARWRAIIESAVDGIVVIDAQGRIEAFNPAAERLFGYAEREVHRPERQHAHAVAVPRGARRLSRPISGDRQCRRSSASAARSPACAGTARRFRCICRSAR